MKIWSNEEVKDIILKKEWYKTERKIQNGVQYILTDDTPIDCYNTGKVVVRKKTSIKEEAEKIFSEAVGLQKLNTVRKSRE